MIRLFPLLSRSKFALPVPDNPLVPKEVPTVLPVLEEMRATVVVKVPREERNKVEMISDLGSLVSDEVDPALRLKRKLTLLLKDMSGDERKKRAFV